LFTCKHLYLVAISCCNEGIASRQSGHSIPVKVDLQVEQNQEVVDGCLVCQQKQSMFQHEGTFNVYFSFNFISSCNA
jgi:hypothetical protein